MIAGDSVAITKKFLNENNTTDQVYREFGWSGHAVGCAR